MRSSCKRLQEAVQQFNRVAFLQSCARGAVSLVGKTTTAFLATGLKKFAEIELQRRASADFAQTVSLPLAIGRAATAATTAAIVAVSVVDTAFANTFSEEGNGTWTGALKRNAPGLLTAAATTFITGAALPETLTAYAVYKVADRVIGFLREYGEDAQVQVVNCQLAVAQATSVTGVITGSSVARQKIH